MTLTQKQQLTDVATAAWRLALRAVSRPTVLQDDYVEWLMLANAGMQHPGNVYLFDLAIKTAPNAPMLEIGSFCGLSTNIIQYFKRKYDRTVPLFTCDKWIFEGAENPLPPYAPVSHPDIRDYVRESFERAVGRFSDGDLPFTIEATSDEFFSHWQRGDRLPDIFGRDVSLGGPLGFCFIDGNHSEAFALRDFKCCDQYLLPGGLILFDDSGDESNWEVKKVIRHIKRGGRYEVVAKNPNYLLRKKS